MLFRKLLPKIPFHIVHWVTISTIVSILFTWFILIPVRVVIFSKSSFRVSFVIFVHVIERKHHYRCNYKHLRNWNLANLIMVTGVLWKVWSGCISKTVRRRDLEKKFHGLKRAREMPEKYFQVSNSTATETYLL